MTVRSPRILGAIAGVAALGALGAGVASAQGTVKSSTWSVTQISQVSSVQTGHIDGRLSPTLFGDPTAGTFDYTSTTSFTWKGRPGRNRITVNHTGRPGVVGLSRRAQKSFRSGSMSWLSSRAPEGQAPFTCEIERGPIPARERSVSFLLVPKRLNTLRRPNELLVQVQGPDAVEEISKAVRTEGCRTPILAVEKTPPKRRLFVPQFDSFAEFEPDLKREFRGKRRLLTLSGREATPLIVANGIKVGEVEVRTTVRMRLVGST